MTTAHFLGKCYGQKFVQQLKTIICVGVLGKEGISFYTWLQLAREDKCQSGTL